MQNDIDPMRSSRRAADMNLPSNARVDLARHTLLAIILLMFVAASPPTAEADQFCDDELCIKISYGFNQVVPYYVIDDDGPLTIKIEVARPCRYGGEYLEEEVVVLIFLLPVSSPGDGRASRRRERVEDLLMWTLKLLKSQGQKEYSVDLSELSPPDTGKAKFKLCVVTSSEAITYSDLHLYTTDPFLIEWRNLGDN